MLLARRLSEDRADLIKPGGVGGRAPGGSPGAGTGGGVVLYGNLQKGFWNDLSSARKKISLALIYGMGIRIEGGSYVLRGVQIAEGGEQAAVSSKEVEISLMERELQLLRTRLDLLSSRMASLKGKENEEPKKEDLTS
jgi:hypothetical protein